MSGGTFEYSQYQIRTIWETIQSELERQGKEIPKDDQWNSDEWLENYPEDEKYKTYPEEIQQIFKDGIKCLKLAEIYAQRIDWFLAGDDGEETLIERLKEDLDNKPIK